MACYSFYTAVIALSLPYYCFKDVFLPVIVKHSHHRHIHVFIYYSLHKGARDVPSMIQ
jgi:hypothetical protein